MANSRRDRRWRNLLLDSKLQLRYAGQMFAVSGGLTLALGFLVYHFNAEASRVVSVRAMDPTDETAQFLQAEFARNGRLLMLALVAFGLLLSMALALWQIVSTHKIAGPLFYISHQARRIRDGKLGVLHALRKNDALHNFFETFAAMHAALKLRAQTDMERLARLAEQAEQAGETKIAEDLRAMVRERQDSLS